MTKQEKLGAATSQAAARARAAGTKATKRFIAAADAMLVAQGKAAKIRQRKRAVKAALKTAGKTALVAGTAAAAVMAVRALRRKRASARGVPGFMGRRAPSAS